MQDSLPSYEIKSLPWMLPVWNRLTDLINRERLPHALMFRGVSGLGKRVLAESLAKKLLCINVGDDACGTCKNCQLYDAETHPDLFYCIPAEDSKVIKVDRVRELNEFVSQSAQIATYKVVILDPASALNLNSANALLKCLEEPSGKAIYILLDHQSGHVLPTIRSRCQVMDIRVPNTEVLAQWVVSQLPAEDSGAPLLNRVEDVLPLSLGAPLSVRQLLLDSMDTMQDKLVQALAATLKNKASPVETTKLFLELPVSQLLSWQVNWLDSIIRFQLTNNVSEIRPLSAKDVFKFLGENVPASVLYQLRSEILAVLDNLTSNLNENLLVENSLVHWKRLMTYRNRQLVA